MKKGMSTILGSLLYLGLFAGALGLIGMFSFLPIPWWGICVMALSMTYGGAFVFRTLYRKALCPISVAAGVSCLSCIAWLSWEFGGWERIPVLVIAVICLVLWLISVGGLLAAKNAELKWPSARARRMRILTAFSAVLMVCLGLSLYEAGLAAYSGKWSARLTAPSLKVDATELVKTQVVPAFDVPIVAGTNLIWCAPFQLAWNEMSDFVGKEIHFAENEPDCVPCLNQRLVTKAHLDDEIYIAAAGAYTPDFVQELNSKVQSKFGSNAFEPEEFVDMDGLEQLAAFGYLSVNLPFEYAFQRAKKPLNFRGVPVKAFTIPFGMGSHIREEQARRQVQVCYPPEEEDSFVVELKTRKADHQLILAKVVPEETLAKMVDKVVGYVGSLNMEPLSSVQDLMVPLFNFDITKEYRELIGNKLATKNPAYQGWRVGGAKQNIRFQLDERGAVLQSSSSMVACACIPPPPCVFDEPFLLMIRCEGSEKPYFAMWVDNAEILVKAE
jgi:hypothetical protein